jgi:Zn-dependent protease
MILNMSLAQIAMLLPLLLLSLTVHEWAHGQSAALLGDFTARESGRLTLNPIKHIDLFGLIMLLMVGVGWAKPVPVDPNRMGSPRRDLVLVSLAGPASNLAIALLFGFLARLYRGLAEAGALGYWEPLFQVLVLMTVINTLLCVFNMLPFPPLDGSKVVAMAASRRWPEWTGYYLRYGSYLLLAILVLQVGFNVRIIPFNAVTSAVLGVIAG